MGHTSCLRSEHLLASIHTLPIFVGVLVEGGSGSFIDLMEGGGLVDGLEFSWLVGREGGEVQQPFGLIIRKLIHIYF